MTPRRQFRLIALALASALLLSSGSLCMAQSPSADLTPNTWSRLLRNFSNDGRVDYAGLSRQPDLLKEYLAALESTEADAFVDWPSDQRLAFWINAYNAYTVRWILDHYPTDGILETVSLWRRALGAPFNIAFIPLGHLASLPDRTPDTLLSLADIEHQILRKRFDDPRIHFAIVCASRSCPKLRGTPYTAADIDRQLDENARDFLQDPSKNRWEARERRLLVSKIFRWFREDFEAEGGPAGYFARYGPFAAEPGAVRESSDRGGPGPDPAVAYLDYDWSLND